MRRVALALAVCAAAAPTRAAAQLPGLLPPGSYVQDVWYPKILWTAREGFAAGGYLAFIAPMTYATFDQAAPFRGAITLDGQVTTVGSRWITLDAYAPAFVNGWRFRLTGVAERRTRENYFGLGNDAVNDDALTAADDLFYRSRNTRLTARAEVQRTIVGGLRLLAGAQAERWTIAPLTAGSRLAQDRADGTAPRAGAGTTDRSVRAGLVYDTRDSESVPRRGVLLEAIHGVGEAGGQTYSRTTVSARGYVTPSPLWTIAGRVAGQGMGGTPPVGSLYLFEASDRPFTALGGGRSHRALADHRFLGEHVLLTNLDVQYTAAEVPTLVRAVVVGFVDAGRVFQGEDFRVTTDGLHVGAGLGVMLHLFRNAVLGLTGGTGPDGFVLQSHTSWPF